MGSLFSSHKNEEKKQPKPQRNKCNPKLKLPKSHNYHPVR